jgi:hypothetical protein
VFLLKNESASSFICKSTIQSEPYKYLATTFHYESFLKMGIAFTKAKCGCEDVKQNLLKWYHSAVPIDESDWKYE